MTLIGPSWAGGPALVQAAAAGELRQTFLNKDSRTGMLLSAKERLPRAERVP